MWQKWQLHKNWSSSSSFSNLTLAVKKIRNEKAPGRDSVSTIQLSTEIIKVVASNKGEYLLFVINQILEQGNFPNILKIAKLILIKKFKKKQ